MPVEDAAAADVGAEARVAVDRAAVDLVVAVAADDHHRSVGPVVEARVPHNGPLNDQLSDRLNDPRSNLPADRRSGPPHPAAAARHPSAQVVVIDRRKCRRIGRVAAWATNPVVAWVTDLVAVWAIGRVVV